jgi:NADH:ubiquinone reductase (H+-translocating)
MRRRLLRAFEQAENEPDPARMQCLLTFVVVGGGPTRAALAGAIADISSTVLSATSAGSIPSGPASCSARPARVLAAFPARLSALAERDLTRLGIEVRTRVL